MFGFEQFSVEMIVVLALGLMVLGPKELPVVLRRLGQFVGKMRGMAAEFRASFDELARQSEIDALRQEVEALKRGEFAASSSAPAPEPQSYDYHPFDNAAHGLDNTGLTFPPQPRVDAPPVMSEASPPSDVAAEPEKPARKPRARKAPSEPATEGEPVATRPRRTRAKAAAAPAGEGEGA